MRGWPAAGLVMAVLAVAPAPAAAQAPPPVSFEVGMVTARETDPDVRVGVKLSQPHDEVLRVDWSAGPPVMIGDASAALEGRDYTGGKGTLEFAPGETREEIVLTLLDDGIYDGGGMLALTLAPGGPNGPYAIVDIHDDEAPPPVSIADVAVPESAGAATVRVVRPWPSTFAERYGWSTAAGTATTGADFAARTGLVGMPYMATTGDPELQVPIEHDTADEPDETFEVRLATMTPPSPWGWSPGRIGDGVARVTILDDDPPGAVATLTARRARGRVFVRLPGARRQRLSGDLTLAPGALVDARRGAVVVRYAGGSATLAGGVLKVREADRLALAGGTRRGCRGNPGRVLRRIAVAADPGLTVAGRHATTSAAGERARWTVADRCRATRVTVRAGRVTAAGRGGRSRDLRAGRRRSYR